MKGDEKVIDYLNKALRHELTAVNQYWLHYRLLEDWGYAKLAAKERMESIEEMQHADKLVERILFLEGFPNMQSLDPLRIGQSLKEVMEADLAGEYSARALYRLARHLRAGEAFPNILKVAAPGSADWHAVRQIFNAVDAVRSAREYADGERRAILTLGEF